MSETPRTSASATPGSSTASGPLDLTGRVLGDFCVLRRLGQGGMGQVYLAEQLSLKRKVALKILKAELAADEVALRRFEAEAKAVARVTHANIVQVYAIGQGEGVHYMALEYVEGVNLREYLDKKGPPSVQVALNIMRQVAGALARASELGIAHRDIKPDNILMTRKAEVKVADFGLSRCFQGEAAALNLTQSGLTLGTPLYMSPEQVRGQPIDARTDIYSFGATAYHLLTGQPPFRGETPIEVALKHLNEEPPPLRVLRPDLPAELEIMIARMMSKKPEDRYQTCRDLLRDVNRLRDKLSSTQRLPTVETAESGPSTAIQTSPNVPILPAAPPAPQPAPAPPRYLVRWGLLFGLSLLVAAGAGAAVAWKVNPERAAMLTSLEQADAAPVPVVSPEETFLRREAARFSETGRDGGAATFLNLGLIYLEQERWAEARELFDRLRREPNANYHGLGLLGSAIVLAREDRPRESNQYVQDYLKQTESGGKGNLLNQPRLRAQLARALKRNQVNLEASKQQLPAELLALCKPQHYPAPESGKKKAK
jgi:serine/threonine-protein kinase